MNWCSCPSTPFEPTGMQVALHRLTVKLRKANQRDLNRENFFCHSIFCPMGDRTKNRMTKNEKPKLRAFRIVTVNVPLFLFRICCGQSSPLTALPNVFPHGSGSARQIRGTAR